MSALISKQSSKANVAISFNNNQPKSSHRNAVIKNDKTASKYSSSALSNKNEAMQITFQKTGQKIIKNLSKQFQTFNINNQDKLSVQKKSDLKSSNKNGNNQKMTKSKTHAQMTTQAKSLLMKSNLSSKSKLSQYQQQQQQQQKYGISQKKTRNKQQLRNSRQRSNRSKSPLSENNRSRKSSPQMSPSYSKKSIGSMSKRAFSKSKLSQKSNNNNNNVLQKSQRQQYQQEQQQINKSSFMKQKNNTTQRKSKTQRNDFHINFPQLITQSQSIYPSSSYPNTGPNTGKLSQHHQNPNYSSKEYSRDKMYIAQEQQSGEFVQNQQQTEEDYISEQQGQQQLQQQSYPNLGISDTYQSKQLQTQLFNQTKDINRQLTYSYQQLPLSYITAMQILQKTIQQHQKTIKKLHKQIKTKDNKYLQLENHAKELQSQLQHRQEIIEEKQSEIRFLKGYLNQEKINNRQALKQIAKNVYERSVSAKKDVRVIKNKQIDDEINTSAGKEKRKLFQTSPLKQHKEKIIQLEESSKKSQPDFVQKLIGSQQINQMKQLQHSQQRQKMLKQQLQKQQLIKDQMMRQQILRQQALLKKQNQQKKRYQYLQQEDIRDSKIQRRQELGRSLSRVKNYHEESDNNFVSELKRVRSVSTTIKPTQQKYGGHTIYRPRNVSVNYNQEIPYYADQNMSHRKPSYQRTPLKNNQPLKDPVLEKYIQAKSQISPHPYSYTYNLTASKQIKQLGNQFYQGGDNLKSEKKNRDTVSKMRQLMRAEKELIALNYKLQAFEKKILNTVQSTSGHDSNRIPKSQQQKQTQSILLEQMQKQYSMMKKQFQKKELQVKELKMNLQRQV